MTVHHQSPAPASSLQPTQQPPPLSSLSSSLSSSPMSAAPPSTASLSVLAPLQPPLPQSTADRQHEASLIKWFLQLAPDQRAVALTTQSTDIVQALCEMHFIKARKGDGTFSSVEGTVGMSVGPSSASPSAASSQKHHHAHHTAHHHHHHHHHHHSAAGEQLFSQRLCLRLCGTRARKRPVRVPVDWIACFADIASSTAE
ncbi:hypothetical protein CAOG_08821 [Capsaspora owczarzaki ATCC 30864]|uniref:hypothetical protein n=1 Tax=Capsaspora owczarzaki (strain ATCC 30864) TaxID=595528 RepID=UPI0003522187|nr:hypothetical protein CAOG_08821 [Capsaspora owczarzaki ATCC 30864]|eukprot:XP_011270461.1 hypothetical protein CAOG_08821 [Capsaspora owczarzaki ATCC 30864]